VQHRNCYISIIAYLRPLQRSKVKHFTLFLLNRTVLSCIKLNSRDGTHFQPARGCFVRSIVLVYGAVTLASTTIDDKMNHHERRNGRPRNARFVISEMPISAFRKMDNWASEIARFGIRPNVNMSIRKCKKRHSAERRKRHLRTPSSASGRMPNSTFSEAHIVIWTNAKVGMRGWRIWHLAERRVSHPGMPYISFGGCRLRHSQMPNISSGGCRLRHSQMPNISSGGCRLRHSQMPNISSARCQIWHSRTANLASRQMEFLSSQIPRSDSAYNF
jgi:hypothetical protein